MEQQQHVLYSAYQLNEFDIHLTLASHIYCDNVRINGTPQTKFSFVSLPKVFQGQFVQDYILPILNLCRLGDVTEELFQRLLKIASMEYTRSFYYLLNFLHPSEVLKYLEYNHLPAPSSVFEKWVLAKYSDPQLSSPGFSQPVINTHHQWLSATAFSEFVRQTSTYSPIQRIFTSQPCVSNGHIDLLMPSVYEYVLSGIKGDSHIIRPPLLICDIANAANKEVIKRLIDTELIEHVMPQTSTANSLLSRISNSSDFIELTHTCEYLSRYGLINIYTSDVLQENHALTTNVTEIVTRKMCAEYSANRFILLHSRDSSYKGQKVLTGRDANFNLLSTALSKLELQSQQNMVRMGVSGIRCNDPNLLVYDKTADPYPIADDILLSNCRAFIGTTSGPGHYSSSLFGKPTLLLNATTLAASSIPSRSTIFSLKHIYSLSGNSRQEKIASLMDVWFDGRKAKFRELNISEIQDDLTFFNRYLSGVFSPMNLFMVVGQSQSLKKSYLMMTCLTPRCYKNLTDVLKY